MISAKVDPLARPINSRIWEAFALGMWGPGRTTFLAVLAFFDLALAAAFWPRVRTARRKGKWVGGCPVLGYDVDPTGPRLVVNEEAERVRAIFALFEKHGSMMLALAADITA